MSTSLFSLIFIVVLSNVSANFVCYVPRFGWSLQRQPPQGKSSLVQSLPAQSLQGQLPYGRPPAEQPPQVQLPQGQLPYGCPPEEQLPQGQSPFVQPPPAQTPQGQAPMPQGQSPYGCPLEVQLPQGQSPFVQPPPAQTSQGQSPYGCPPEEQPPPAQTLQGQSPYGCPPEEQPPQGQSPLVQPTPAQSPQGQAPLPQEETPQSQPSQGKISYKWPAQEQPQQGQFPHVQLPPPQAPQEEPSKKVSIDSSEDPPKTCAEIQSPGEDVEGVYEIQVGKSKFHVFCIPDPISGPAWTIIQRRMDGSVNFNRSWEDYENGFGNASGEHWIGLKKMHELTTHRGGTELWVQLINDENESRFAIYHLFYIGDAKTKYMLNVAQYHGNAGDSMRYYNDQKFTTFDNNNDESKQNCVEKFKGAWWTKNCLGSQLNGDYGQYFQTLKYVHMAIRPFKYSD